MIAAGVNRKTAGRQAGMNIVIVACNAANLRLHVVRDDPRYVRMAIRLEMVWELLQVRSPLIFFGNIANSWLG